jgi:AraC-like DNA-binding protein
MDLLTDILRQAGLRHRVLDLRALTPAQALRFPCDKSLGLHVALQGPVYIHSPGRAAPLVLQSGDIAIMARGHDHVVAMDAKVDKRRIATIFDQPTGAVRPLAPAGRSRLISGAYQFWNAPIHPFLATLPDWFVLRGAELPRLGPVALTVGLVGEEAANAGEGAQTILHGLLDVLFAYLLREIASRNAETGPGLGKALADAHVKQAIALMHADYARGWTLETLAEAVGLSRTRLAERFRAAMDDTPLAYLRTVRMQAAMRLLSETDKKLDDVAAQVGYQDAFGFSKMFKRTVGVAPKEFRRRDLADRASPWRLAAS